MNEADQKGKYKKLKRLTNLQQTIFNETNIR